MSDEVQTRYVEVPTVEWREVRVPKKEVVELVRRVPKVEVIETEKLVEIHEIHEVPREVEIIQTEDVIRHVPKKEVVNVPVEVIKHVPKVETVVREQVVNVPGEVIEVVKPYRVETRQVVPTFRDKKVLTVVAQTARPVFRPVANQEVPVVARDCDPVLIKVVVPVIKPVRTPVWEGARSDVHSYVSVPPAEYNSLLLAANKHLPSEYYQDLLVTDFAGVAIPPVTDSAVLVPPLGPVKGTPPPPPQSPPRLHSHSRAHTAHAEPAPRPWRPPSALLYGPWSKDQERYYREHHEWFSPEAQYSRSPAKKGINARAKTGSTSTFSQLHGR
eukprot:Gregarina_sp_Poly_1__11301@NODE_942_length_5613_cov_183_854850_g668_i0_p3_GENE_NODE_942_length_5613_cov_183_854850_g668_i0NODE_942_length_5613_cov_183_854850_g668_i0_p3_ORF_typecomplete_len329_score53_12IMCp/PF12314_8/9_2e05IMCp/PF12314_8/5_2e03_NODE_942_length_5613_cov_183_854850_g668_i043245310